MGAWQGKCIFGKEFARVVVNSKINLNIIDSTNFPAANMRFFEIPCAGGFQVSSPCPEMEGKFKHGESIFYYRTPEELPDMIHSLLNNDPLRIQVAQKAHAMVLNEHTYKHRAQQILGLMVNNK
jgi:spore maturation protein CgeB